METCPAPSTRSAVATSTEGARCSEFSTRDANSSVSPTTRTCGRSTGLRRRATTSRTTRSSCSRSLHRRNEMNRKKSLGVVAAGAAGALLLAACGGGTTSSSGSGSDDNGAVLPNTAWAKASYDDVKQGGTVTQAVGQLPFNFNAYQADDGLGDTYTIEYPLLLGGVVFKPNGEWTVDKNTVESAKLVSKSPQKIEVKLNPKAVWSDGKPITWQDMVDTWKALNGSNPKYQIISDNGFKDISSIEKGDDEDSYTITYNKVKKEEGEHKNTHKTQKKRATPRGPNHISPHRPLLADLRPHRVQQRLHQ